MPISWSAPRRAADADRRDPAVRLLSTLERRTHAEERREGRKRDANPPSPAPVASEQVRYTVDTGSAPPRPRPGLLGRARYVLIPLGAVGMLAASTYALQATRGLSKLRTAILPSSMRMMWPRFLSSVRYKSQFV